MRVRLISGWLILLMLVAAMGYAQQPPAAPAAPAQVARLSLAEALELARRNSPDYRAVLNNRWAATMARRAATISLVTPTVDLNYVLSHRNEGTSFVTGIPTPFTSPGTSSRSWQLSFGYRLSLATLSQRGLASAESRATESDIAGAQTLLETGVRTQYLNLLQARAQEALAVRMLERSQEALELARARYTVGQATLIDLRRAQVDSGTAAVRLLTDRQSVTNEMLRLFQAIGVPAPAAQVEPTDSFAVTAPAFELTELIRQAETENPTLRAMRAREASARWNTRSAWSEYLPSLNVGASFGGYRQSFDATASSPASSTTGKSPFGYQVFISQPLYDGFAAAARIQQARGQADDLRHSIRSQELALQAAVTSAYLGLQAAYQQIALQEANRRASLEALDLATQRYRVGSGSYLELLDARVGADQADALYVGAVYGYHRAIATLENAVGRPLR